MPSYLIVLARGGKVAFLSPPIDGGRPFALKLGPMGRYLTWPSTEGIAPDLPSVNSLRMTALDERSTEPTPFPGLEAPETETLQNICDALRSAVTAAPDRTELSFALGAHLNNLAASHAYAQRVTAATDAIGESMRIFAALTNPALHPSLPTLTGFITASYNHSLVSMLLHKIPESRHFHELAFRALDSIPSEQRDGACEFLDTALYNLNSRILNFS